MDNSQKSVFEQLHQYAKDAPKTSGVYLWRDEKECVIYVGKAKSLKNRLSSYFLSRRDIKTRILVSRARSIEYIQTANEYEALILENNLIKKYKPRYNINLKDGKTYPVLKITNERFPRLYRTRVVQHDGSRYFGPFPNVPALDDFLSLIKRHYTVRQCKRFKQREPCLYFHIGRCSAPCAGKISEEAYRKDIEEIALLLDGDIESAIAGLQTAMKTAAAAREFEKAARIRDGIQAVYALRGQNVVEDMDPEARDYIAWAAEASLMTFTVLKMRGGKVVGRDLYRTESLKDESEVLPEFLMAYYTDMQQIPPHIFVPAVQDSLLAEQWLTGQFGVSVTITAIPLADSEQSSGVPLCAAESICAAEPPPSYTARSIPPAIIQRHRAALAMAHFNAKEDAARRMKERGDFPALEELKNILHLEKIPERIEGFDIAHLHGKYTVASLISFKNGNPDKKNYRIFRLRTTDGIIDDYASMREAVSRRYTRLLNESAELPDLILIDGGLGQVNAAKSILDALDLPIPLIGLAEKNEEIYLPHNGTPLILPRRSAALRVLQRVRDETHRFANSKNNRLRSKETLQLTFEQLPHIGKKRAVILLKEYSSLAAVAAAAPEPLAALLGISEKAAEEVCTAAGTL
ncbi:MAG: excinuclease ABC subunit UvrC [Treponema sp.]